MTAVVGNGGFESFIRTLQKEVNPYTFELQLTVAEENKIVSYANGLMSCNSQDQLTDIFSRHIDVTKVTKKIESSKI